MHPVPQNTYFFPPSHCLIHIPPGIHISQTSAQPMPKEPYRLNWHTDACVQKEMPFPKRWKWKIDLIALVHLFPLRSPQIWNMQPKTRVVSPLPPKKRLHQNPRPHTSVFAHSPSSSSSSRKKHSRIRNFIFLGPEVQEPDTIITKLRRKTPLIGRPLASEQRSRFDKGVVHILKSGTSSCFSVGKDWFSRLQSSFGSRIKRLFQGEMGLKKWKSKRLFGLKSSDFLQFDSTEMPLEQLWHPFSTLIA